LISPGYKSIELVGTSEKGWKEAVLEAYRVAKQTVYGIRTIQILETDVKIKEDLDDKFVFRARIRINFQIAER